MPGAVFLDTSRLSKAEVLSRLYNASNMAHRLALADAMRLPFEPDDMTIEDAQAVIDRLLAGSGGNPGALYFDYLRGRVLKIRLNEQPLNVALYDRDNGPGAAARALGLESL